MALYLGEFGVVLSDWREVGRSLVLPETLVRPEVGLHRAVDVPGLLLGFEVGQERLHRFQEPLFVDEGDEYDGLPILLLAVEVVLELGRVVVDDGRGFVEHQASQGLQKKNAC